MNTRIAYIIVIVIWSTTPLAIQWSGDGVGYLFGVTWRMFLGMLCTLITLAALRQELPRHTKALQTYVASGLGIYGAMSCVYWSSQFIPSGWISIIFGLSPLITGILAAVLLKEDALAPHKLFGVTLGFIGLLITFGEGFETSRAAVLGISGTLVGTCMHCMSAVTVKRIDAKLSGLSITGGGLLVAVPLYLLTWFTSDSAWPMTIEWRAGLSIVYLGTIGSVVGFALYYYVLRHMDVSRVALITLITPICAISLGHWLNEEPITNAIILGTACIVSGLLCYEFGRPLMDRFRTI
ncbi:MAG: DMT family transporter [Gammaproteobacteria bacterium]